MQITTSREQRRVAQAAKVAGGYDRLPTGVSKKSKSSGSFTLKSGKGGTVLVLRKRKKNQTLASE